MPSDAVPIIVEPWQVRHRRLRRRVGQRWRRIIVSADADALSIVSHLDGPDARPILDEGRVELVARAVGHADPNPSYEPARTLFDAGRLRFWAEVAIPIGSTITGVSELRLDTHEWSSSDRSVRASFSGTIRRMSDTEHDLDERSGLSAARPGTTVEVRRTNQLPRSEPPPGVLTVHLGDLRPD